MRFKRDELLYDIRNAGYIVAHLLSDEEQHRKHLIEDIGEEGNVDRVIRMIELAWAEVTELLYRYTRVSVHDMEMIDDCNQIREEYCVYMRADTDYSRTTLRLLKNWVHEYIVASVMADWLTVIWAEQGAVWQQKAQAAKDGILEACVTKTGASERPMYPI